MPTASEKHFFVLKKETGEEKVLFFLCCLSVTPGSAGDTLDLEGASLGKQTSLLRTAEQKDGKNLGAW